MRIVDTIARWVEYPRAPASSMGGGRARRPDVRRCRLDRASKQYEVAKAEHDAVEREKAEAAKPRVPACFFCGEPAAAERIVVTASSPASRFASCASPSVSPPSPTRRQSAPPESPTSPRRLRP